MEMAIHNLLDALKRMDMEDDGAIMNVPGVGYILAWGTTVPVDGTSFYAPGCVFIHTDGTGEDVFSVNQGTYDSCAFKGFETALQTDLASTATSKGASMIGVEDSASNFAGTTVEAILAEIIADYAATTASNGASKIGVQDASALFTGTTVESVLAEIKQGRIGADQTDADEAVAIGAILGGYVVLPNTAARTYTLATPTAGMAGIECTFIKSTAAAFAATLATTGAEQINGSDTYVEMDAIYDSVTLKWTGTGWMIKCKNIAA